MKDKIKKIKKHRRRHISDSKHVKVEFDSEWITCKLVGKMSPSYKKNFNKLKKFFVSS